MESQIDRYLANAIAELKSLQPHFDSRVFDNAIGMIEAARSPILDAIDNALADEAKAESAGKPTMPDDLAGKMLAGEMHPLKAWRTAADLTQETLAFMAGISIIVVDLIESEPLYQPPYRVVRSIATALGLGTDDIMPV